MKNTSSPVFRNAVGGFNKSDVNEYIAKLCSEYESTAAEYEKETDRLRGELEEALGKISALEAAAKEKAEATANEALDNANNIIAAQAEEISSLTERSEALALELEEAAGKLSAMSELEAKAAEYDAMTARMGEIFMDATADADRIRAEAKASADILMSETKAECDARKAKCEAQLNEYADSRKADLTRLFGETQAGINRVLASFGEKSKSIINKPMSAINEFETVKTSKEA